MLEEVIKVLLVDHGLPPPREVYAVELLANLAQLPESLPQLPDTPIARPVDDPSGFGHERLDEVSQLLYLFRLSGKVAHALIEHEVEKLVLVGLLLDLLLEQLVHQTKRLSSRLTHLGEFLVELLDFSLRLGFRIAPVLDPTQLVAEPPLLALLAVDGPLRHDADDAEA